MLGHGGLFHAGIEDQAQISVLCQFLLYIEYTIGMVGQPQIRDQDPDQLAGLGHQPPGSLIGHIMALVNVLLHTRSGRLVYMGVVGKDPGHRGGRYIRHPGYVIDCIFLLLLHAYTGTFTTIFTTGAGSPAAQRGLWASS